MKWFWRKKKTKKSPRNLNEVNKLFIETYRHYQKQNPQEYPLNLDDTVSKTHIIDFFKEQEWTMQVAYNNTKKGERLNKGRNKNTNSGGGIIPAEDLLNSAIVYNKAIEILEKS